MGTQLFIEQLDAARLFIEGTFDRDNRTVDQVIIEAGWSKNGNPFYPETTLQAAVNLFEGVRTMRDHPTPADLKARKSRSTGEITGWIENVRYENGRLVGTRHFTRNAAGNDVFAIVEDIVAGAAPKSLMGGSINALGNGGKGKAPDGKEGIIAEEFTHVHSVDDVVSPAAGGGFLPLVAGGDDLIAALMQTVTYEEFIEARPDYIEAVRKQMKRARQDEQVRALTEERDAAKTASEDLRTHNEQLTADLTAARAEIARLEQELALNEAFRTCNFKPDYERLLREQLANTPLDQWQHMLALEIQKAKTTRLGATPVKVHGVPLRESVGVQVGGRRMSGPINPDEYDSPQKFYAEVQRRKHARL